MAMDVNAVAIHPRSNAASGRKFRDASSGFTFQYGQGIPGRVWESGSVELQTNVQALPENLFLRKAIAPVAGYAGSVAQAISMPGDDDEEEEVVAVICAFLNASLDSPRGGNCPSPLTTICHVPPHLYVPLPKPIGMDVVINDMQKLQLVARDIGRAIMRESGQESIESGPSMEIEELTEGEITSPEEGGNKMSYKAAEAQPVIELPTGISSPASSETSTETGCSQA